MVGGAEAAFQGGFRARAGLVGRVYKFGNIRPLGG